MRLIKIRFGSRHDVYIRKASLDYSQYEIQGQYGGIIVTRPKVRRSIRFGVILEDHGNYGVMTRHSVFTDRTSGFERNDYVIENYRR